MFRQLYRLAMTKSHKPITAQDAGRQVSKEQLAELASPSPSLTTEGLLDAGPNATYDLPVVDDDLVTLPLRQAVLIRTLLSDLPQNAPRHLKQCLENYDEELKARGVQPILGILKDMSDVVRAAVGATNAEREWLEEGMKAAFEVFESNHDLFMRHFPLDMKREDLYAGVVVDEDSVVGREFKQPFEELAKAAAVAKDSHMATEDFLRIVDKMAEFSVVISTLPPRQTYQVQNDQEDRSGQPDSRVSPKKRLILSGFGFVERAYNLLGTTAGLASSPEGNPVLVAFRRVLSAISKWIGF